MNYYLAKTDTLEKVIDLKVNTISTTDYINLTIKYPQIITGEYILLSEGETPTLNSNTCWGLHCDDDEYGDETVGWVYSSPKHHNEDDEYGDETTGWGY